MSIFFAFIVCIWLSSMSLVHADTCANSCQPWMGTSSSCTIKSSLSLRFQVDVAAQHSFTQNNVKVREASYAFCPQIDQLQSFSLNHAPYYASTYNATPVNGSLKYTFTKNMTKNYLLVYGFGNSHETLEPQRGISSGAVIVAQNGSSICGQSNSVALVTTLILDVGLHKGRFNYFTPSATGNVSMYNINYDPNQCPRGIPNAGAPPNVCNETVLVNIPDGTTVPAKTGFQPTCNGDDVCMFDKSLTCIGDVKGQRNCARCYIDPSQVLSATLQIWTSYYGTDSNSRTLTSGSVNPLNFLRFARDDVFQQISNSFSNTWHGIINDFNS